MSYCRFSSDDWKSDVYAYESCCGWFIVHVAGNRVAGDIPTLPKMTSENADEWDEAHKAQMAFLDSCERKNITLPHAAEEFHEPDAAACADRLESLRAIGYHVPQYAIDTLREEASSSQCADCNGTRKVGGVPCGSCCPTDDGPDEGVKNADVSRP